VNIGEAEFDQIKPILKREWAFLFFGLTIED